MATSQDAPQDISLITGPVNRLDNPTDHEQSTILQGQQAWHGLRHDHSCADWTQVGAAVVIGRSGAMREAAVNRPVGRRYNVLFAAWLKQFDFENLDKTDRSRLFAVMDHLEEIEAWRATLTPAERLHLIHPSTVLRKWKSANAISPNQNSRLSPIKQCRQENSALQQGILRLREDCEPVAGDRWQPADRPEDIATAMLAKLGRGIKRQPLPARSSRPWKKKKKKLSVEPLWPSKSLRSSMHHPRRDALQNIGVENATSRSPAQRPEPTWW
jgi:hypothetical protein